MWRACLGGFFRILKSSSLLVGRGRVIEKSPAASQRVESHDDVSVAATDGLVVAPQQESIFAQSSECRFFVNSERSYEDIIRSRGSAEAQLWGQRRAQPATLRREVPECSFFPPVGVSRSHDARGGWPNVGATSPANNDRRWMNRLHKSKVCDLGLMMRTANIGTTRPCK
jgi:hypothetical protein